MFVLTEAIGNIVPTRNFNLLYIILDSIFCLCLLALLIWKKRYQTAIFGGFGGILYLLVDYGYFYLISHSRTIMIDSMTADALGTFWVLLWMSLSYGFTNFVFIWTLISKDKYAKYFVFLIIAWWLCCPSISSMGGESTIQTSRTTGAYHGFMAVFLIVSYLILIIIEMKKDKEYVNILRLCSIGVAVQLSWEFALLINGIRPMNENSLMTLLIDSLIETNLGMPAIYGLFCLWRKYRNEDLSKAENRAGN